MGASLPAGPACNAQQSCSSDHQRWQQGAGLAANPAHRWAAAAAAALLCVCSLLAYHRIFSLPDARAAGLKTVAMAQKVDKKKGKEQEVFLGVKGNAQARAAPAARLPPWLSAYCCGLQPGCAVVQQCTCFAGQLFLPRPPKTQAAPPPPRRCTLTGRQQ